MRTLPTILAALLAPALAHAAPPPRPKLIVAIAIDQYSQALHDRYRDSYRAGLGRLDHGIALDGYQSHAATETCPGHSTILTGRHPTATGIVANNWIDRANGKTIYCASVPGADAQARGPANLRVDTFGDWLKAAEPQARVFSISGKDRAAIMLGGHHADGVWWWRDGEGFVTSSHAGPADPAVTAPAAAFDAATFARWRKTAPTLWPTAHGRCAALQRPYRFGDIDVSGRVPPERVAGSAAGDFLASKAFQDELHSAPLFDRMVLDFALATIDRERLGHGPATDLLALSFSATDYVGHRFGSGGAEMCVQLGALDRMLGILFARLDRLHIPYVVVATADHGGTDAAERLAATIPAARRIDTRALLKDLNATLMTRLDLAAPPIVADDAQELFIAKVADPALRSRIRATAIGWLRSRPDVEQVLTPEEVAASAPPPGKSPEHLTIAERFAESFDADRSGDIMVAYRRYATVRDKPVVPGAYVAGHGSVWDEDRRVPILFWWPGVTADRPRSAVETVDIAPTLAVVAGIAAPPVDGRCLAAASPACPR